MKTTIELPDALADRARALAREQGTTLRDLVVSGLREEVARRATPGPRVDFVFRTSGGEGLYPEAVDRPLTELAYDLPPMPE